MKKLTILFLLAISLNVFAQHPCTPPSVTIVGSAWKCKGVKDTLTAITSANGTTYLWNTGSTLARIITGAIEADTTYYVIATNNGCSDTTYFTIDVRVQPNITTSPAIVICGCGPVLLKAVASGTGPFTYSWSPGGATTDTMTVMTCVPTTYTITVSNGCINTKTTTVTPDVPSISACCNTTIPLGDSTVLVASGNNMVYYSWTPGGICLSANCDSMEVAPTVTTTYTVSGIDSFGCSVQRVVTIVVGPASVSSISGTGFVTVYPNPSSTSFTVDLPTKAMIKVCDVTGRLLFSQMENAGTITFGKELNPGIYFLFIDGKPGVKVVKL